MIQNLTFKLIWFYLIWFIPGIWKVENSLWKYVHREECGYLWDAHPFRTGGLPPVLCLWCHLSGICPRCLWQSRWGYIPGITLLSFSVYVFTFLVHLYQLLCNRYWIWTVVGMYWDYCSKFHLKYLQHLADRVALMILGIQDTGWIFTLP